VSEQSAMPPHTAVQAHAPANGAARAAGAVDRRGMPRGGAAPWHAGLRSPWAWLPPCIAILLLTALVAGDADRGVFLWLNGAGRVLHADAWLQLTLLGDGAVALALVLPAIRRAPRSFWAAFIAAAIAAVWVQGIKHMVEVPRPLAVFPPGAFFHVGPAFRHGSFPSGHAAAAFALAGVWVMTPRARLVRLALLALASLVALSRIMVGVHWPTDLLGGMLGGWAGAWIGLAVAGRRGWHTRGRAAFLAGAALLALSALLLVSRHVGVSSVLPLQRLIALVCLGTGVRELAALRAARRGYREGAGGGIGTGLGRTEGRPDG
jgi:membrane-associated phospholipid phosphatase